MCVGIHKSVCVRVIVALRLGHDYGAVGSKFLALGGARLGEPENAGTQW